MIKTVKSSPARNEENERCLGNIKGDCRDRSMYIYKEKNLNLTLMV